MEVNEEVTYVTPDSIYLDNEITNELMKALNIEVVHIQTPSSKYHKCASNGITVAYRRNTRGKSIEIATAVCSKHDQYNKRIGKQLAVARFFNGQYNIIPFSYRMDTRDFLQGMFADAK